MISSMRSILNALQDGRLFELPEADKPRVLEFLASDISSPGAAVSAHIVIGQQDFDGVGYYPRGALPKGFRPPPDLRMRADSTS